MPGPERAAASEEPLTRFELAGRTKRERSQAAILQAARLLIERDGYEQTSVAAIAREASVGLATLYNHYPSKAAVVAEVFAHEIDQVVTVSTRDSAPETHSGSARLVAELGAIAAAAAANRAVTEAVVGGGMSVPRGSEAAAAVGVAQVASRLEDVVAQGQASGELRADVPAATVARILASTLLLEVAADRETRPGDIAELVATLTLEGLAVRDSGR